MTQHIKINGRFAKGFTLIELLVVLAILGLLAGLVGPRVLGQLEGAKTKTAAMQIQDLDKAAEMFKIDVGRFPTNEEGLKALLVEPPNVSKWDGPYLRRALPYDPWDNPFRYRSPGRHADVDIYSYGGDNAPGGDGENGDVGNWD